MVQAWIYNEQGAGDQREQHKLSPSVDVPLSTLAAIGVCYWKLDPLGCEQDPFKGDLGRIRHERRYKNHDIITVSREKLPNYEARIKSFFDEHLHEDEEIRFILEGSGYFDVKCDLDSKWIRISVESGDMLVLPAGMYHRFTLDTSNYIKVIRLFQDAPKWEAINRGDKAESTPSRKQYNDFFSKISLTKDKLYEKQSVTKQSPNGESFILMGGAVPKANYPHMRVVNGMCYVSGTSSRRFDNTYAGVTKKNDGTFELDIRAQTKAVLDNIAMTLSQVGGSLNQIVDLQVFLVDMKDYEGMNEVYNTYFTSPADAPTRTTVAVHQLPNPNLLIEIRCIAVDPRVPKY